MLFRFLFFIFLSLPLYGGPSAAQVNDDILTVQEPGGSGGDFQPDGPSFYCAQCCNREISDPGCCDACNCQCGLTPICPGFQTMSLAKVPLSANVAIRRSMSQALENMKTTERGRRLASVLEETVGDLDRILKKDAQLSARIGKAIVTHWPHDMWAANASGADRVSPDAVRDLRTLLTEVAKADRANGGARISGAIETLVLPFVTQDLVGQSYQKAFACFLGSDKCS